MNKGSEISGVEVIIDKSSKDYETPFGLKYIAKGFYIQKNYIVVVGRQGEQANTIRIKYPIRDVTIKILKGTLDSIC